MFKWMRVRRIVKDVAGVNVKSVNDFKVYFMVTIRLANAFCKRHPEEVKDVLPKL